MVDLFDVHDARGRRAATGTIIVSTRTRIGPGLGFPTRDAGRHRSDLNLSYTCLNLDIDEGGPDLPEPEQGPAWATGSLRHAYSRPV